jgi:hypothetical protein
MFDINLRGLVPLFVSLVVLSVFGIWKLIEIVCWLFWHIQFV